VSLGSCLGPQDGGGEQDAGLVVAGFLVIPGGDSAPLFESVEAAFDDVAVAVHLRVEVRGSAAA